MYQGMLAPVVLIRCLWWINSGLQVSGYKVGIEIMNHIEWLINTGQEFEESHWNENVYIYMVSLCCYISTLVVILEKKLTIDAKTGIAGVIKSTVAMATSVGGMIIVSSLMRWTSMMWSESNLHDKYSLILWCHFRLWRHQQNMNRGSETQSLCMKLVVYDHLWVHYVM